MCYVTSQFSLNREFIFMIISNFFYFFRIPNSLAITRSLTDQSTLSFSLSLFFFFNLYKSFSFFQISNQLNGKIGVKASALRQFIICLLFPFTNGFICSSDVSLLCQDGISDASWHHVRYVLNPTTTAGIAFLSWSFLS